MKTRTAHCTLDFMALIASAIIPAAGKSERLSGQEPKQTRILGNRPVMAWAAAALARASYVSEIIIGAAKDRVGPTEKLLAEWIKDVPVKVVAGGGERQQTVKNCLEAIRPDSEIVAIHDAARPLIKTELVEKVIEAAQKNGAATLAIRPADTIKLADNDKTENLDRQNLWSIQTPQAFRADLIKQAHKKAEKDGFTGTDDTVLVERTGHKVQMVEGHEWNMKITTQADWEMIKALVEAGLAIPAGEEQ